MSLHSRCSQKENDLELAARIGQQLVCRNKALEERQVALESELAAATDANTQLQHQLTLKTNLLSIYTDDIDDSSCDGETQTLFFRRFVLFFYWLIYSSVPTLFQGEYKKNKL